MQAGSLSWDKLHSNADIWDPCLLLPFADKVYFDETSSAGRVYCCICYTCILFVLKTTCLTVLLGTFWLKVPLFLYQTRQAQLTRVGTLLRVLVLNWRLWSRLIKLHYLLSAVDLDMADVRRTNVTHLLNNFIPITVLNWLTFRIKISDV